MSEPSANPPINATPSQPAWSRWLTIGMASLVLLGVGWRLTRYFLQFPIWGDEAHLALNILDRDYLGLTQPLRFVQAAPLLFLWVERAVFEVLGGSELSLRLLSVLAGVSGLLLFGRLAATALPPLPAALAVGILAVSYYPVRHCCEVKPYGIDLFAAVVLLGLAVCWLREPARLRWPVLLTLLTPVLLGMSYPAVIIAGSVSLAMLPAMVKTTWQPRVLYFLYNVVILATFLGYYLLVGAGQYHSTGGGDCTFYQDTFPPSEPLALLRWLLAVHTGNMFAYPVGSHSGGSTVTALFCVAGIVWMARDRRWSLLVLCVSPFLLTLLASALRRYPYGDSARFEQHLAPVICLLTGSGLAVVIEYFARSAVAWRRGVVLAISLLALIGTVGVCRDLFKPYKTEGDRLARQMLVDIVAKAGPEDQVVVMDPMICLAPPMEWYLRQLGQRIVWEGQVDWDRLHGGEGRLWSLYFSQDPARAARLPAKFRKQAAGLVLVDRQEHWIQTGWDWSVHTRKYCEFFEWRCEEVNQE